MKPPKLYGHDVGDFPSQEAPGASDVGEAEIDLDPEPTDRRRPEGDLPTGRGVVVAHIDWGLDITHPEFREKDGRTRVLAFWDQSSAPDPRQPNRYGYGRTYDTGDIERALAATDPYATLKYDPGTASHGTHTLSISAGNGRAGGPVGLAPEAQLVFVHLSTYTAEGPTLLGDSVAFLEALDFISRVAGPRPLVINASLGRHAGPHDGKTLTEQGMDAFLLAAPGRAIVQSTGNYFNRQVHAQGTLRPGQSRTMRLIIDAADRTTNEVDLWYPGVDRLQITLRGPGGAPEVRVAPGKQTKVMVDGHKVGRLYHRIGDPNNGDNEVTLFLYKAAPPGEWQITVFGLDVADGRFHAWVERNAACSKCQARFALDDSEPTRTTGTICNGLRTLAVAAYDGYREERPLAVFSSSGPTRDGRQKPDLAAPGVRVLAARSRPRGGSPDLPLLMRMSGTSMAAPHVTGTIALMFQAAGRPLFIEETRRLLLASAEPLPEDTSADERLRLGSGYLNTTAAIDGAEKASRKMAALVRRTSTTAGDALPNAAEMLEWDNSAQVPVKDKKSCGAMNKRHENEQQEPVEHIENSEPPGVVHVEAAEIGTIIEMGEMEEQNDTEQEPLEYNEYFGTQGDVPEGAPDESNNESAEDDAEGKSDRGFERKWDSRRWAASPSLPFQFQIPIGGGAPALALPVGGVGTPFAFTLPLGGTPPPAQPTLAASNVLIQTATPSQVAAAPPLQTPTGIEEPVTVASADFSLYPPPDQEADNAAQEAAGFGELVLASAEGIVKPGGRPPRSSSAVLESIFGVVSGVESHAEAESMPFDSLDISFGPLGLGGQRPSATVLFNAFVYPDHPLFPRKALRRHYESRFQPMALPGQPMADVNPRPGDLLLRVARGEDWGHIAVVASPQLCRHDRLATAGLRGEGYPRLLPGHYVQVVELQPYRRTLADRFARRLSDAVGLVLPDSLLLRPLLPGGFYGHSEAEADPAERRPVLRAGMTGPWVKEAQQKLNRVHTDSTALGLPGLEGCPLPEDGHFSQRMKQAVTDFQQQVFSDPAKWDGTVGADTSAQLNLIAGSAPSPAPAASGRALRGHQKPTKRGPIPSPSALQEPTPPEAFESVDKPTIRRGSQGPAVSEAQGKLNAIHARQLAQAAPGLPACPLTEDGIFGDKTREAVVGFQQLTFPSQPGEWDGVVGPKTWFALDQFAGGSLPVSPIPRPVPVPSGPAGDARIDVCAQFALQRMQRADAAAQMDAVGMLAAVQSGQLVGIINNVTRAAVQLAQRHGATRFDLVPRGEDAALVLDPTSPLNAPPSIVFRGVETKPGEPTPCPRRERIDPALRKAWATFLLFKSGQLARCDLPEPGASTAFGAGEAFPSCGVVPNLFPQILGQIRGLVTPIRATDVSDYVSLDFVLEALSGPPFTLTRRAPFRTLAELEAELGPPLTTALIGGPIRLDPADSSKFQTRIRMQLVFPASPGNPTHPAGTAKLPLAVLVHGNHEAYRLAAGPLSDKESFRGYRYLQDELARAGIASISVDTNIANETGSLIELRADMVLQAIKLLKRRASRRGDALLNRINFDRLALMGHSRGGDAIVRVVKKNTAAAAADRFGIRTACSLAPTDFTGGQVPASRTFLDHNELSFYSVLYGVLDGDVSGRGGSNAAVGTGFRHYDRARCQKALVFAPRCCHNSFNSVWHADGVESGVRAADRVPGTLVDEATHQQLAKEYICGQFEWHLNGTQARSSLFNGTTPTATGLNTAILWSFGNPIQHVDDFENPVANLAGGTRQLNSGAVLADFGSIVIPPGGSINDHVLEQSHVVHADTASAIGSPFGVETTLPAGRGDLSSLTTVALDVGAFFDTTSEATIAAGAPPTFSVILQDRAGAMATVPSSRFSPAMGRPFFHALASGANPNVTALRLETLQVSVSAFTGIDLRNVVKIQVEVSPPSGHLFVDHIKLAAF